ncbi:c-type cytochrome [Ancylobacter defluvii]|uniref:Cytochrome C556 n=1 Tax=Ancylobacter defluvii TaxID=1282440 RepID=A0A9W6N9F1_9HYPH|nr:cytochrome c [Ancylobacter defluvii]MBS7587748.1 cytochrome c [Ancylobacter defluvii]GLK82558.1 cytochrome C556 [Ancylobacter defluvii]
MMSRKAAFAVAAVISAVAATSVLAQDPIAEREKLMKEWGQATRPVGAMLKGSQPFDLTAVQAALDIYAKHAATMPALFPAGSDGGKTEALPAVWTQNAEFNALFVKFGADATAARAAITDEASFKANFPDVVRTCGTCHQTFRAKS